MTAKAKYVYNGHESEWCPGCSQHPCKGGNPPEPTCQLTGYTSPQIGPLPEPSFQEICQRFNHAERVQLQHGVEPSQSHRDIAVLIKFIREMAKKQ